MPSKKDHPDAQFVEATVERLNAFGPVSARFMFGGFGLYADGVMFGLVDRATLYLRADDANRAEFDAVGSEPWTFEAKGRPMAMPYYPIPDQDFEDDEALARWFTSAVDAAERVAMAKAESPKRRAPKKS